MKQEERMSRGKLGKCERFMYTRILVSLIRSRVSISGHAPASHPARWDKIRMEEADERGSQPGKPQILKILLCCREQEAAEYVYLM